MLLNFGMSAISDCPFFSSVEAHPPAKILNASKVTIKQFVAVSNHEKKE